MLEPARGVSTSASRFAVRTASAVAAGVIAGFPLLVAGPAAAASPEVEFSGGGLGLLACGSRPSDGDLTVAAESTVSFVNKLGQNATLRINGRDASRVGQNAEAEVLFHRGTVRVEMVPDCTLNLNNNFESVSVKVLTPGGTQPPSSSPAGSAQPPVGGPAGQEAGDATSGQGDDSGTDESKSPDDPDRASPSGSPSAPAEGGASPSDAGTVEGPAASDDGEGLAAEPVVTVPTSVERGPNGLLAIIAVVCLIGVAAGAIRAIIAQRATRTGIA